MTGLWGNLKVIVRYTQEVQQLLKSKTKPEPWLHCAITSAYTGKTNKSKQAFFYVIYVWDTREVIEDKQVSTSLPGKQPANIVNAYDNHQPLKGNGKGAKQVNDWLRYDREEDDNLDKASKLCGWPIDKIRQFPHGKYRVGKTNVTCFEKNELREFRNIVWYMRREYESDAIEIGRTTSFYGGELELAKAKAIKKARLKLVQ